MTESKQHAKRARRQAEHLEYLKAHGYACVYCAAELSDDDLWEDVDPREPRSCQACCRQGALRQRELVAIAQELGVEVSPERVEPDGTIVTEYRMPDDPAEAAEFKRRTAHLAIWGSA
jgi:hypothetical protein